MNERTWVSIALAVVFGVAYLYYRRRDRRLLRNGLFLVAALGFGLVGALSLLVRVNPLFGVVLVALQLSIPLLVLLLAGFLLGNGLTMWRRESHSLANLLSLLAGLVLLALPVLAAVFVETGYPALVVTALLLFFLCVYFGVVFVVFLVYSVVYGHGANKMTPAAVVVLGSKLFDGRVPPLLRSRLDKSLEVYWRGVKAGRAPLLIPSGGRGPDETRAEGAAMAEYLIDRGVRAEDVRPETEARNTEENLVFSSAVQASAGRTGPTLVVTNNYHVLRAAVLARRTGTNAQVVGAPTARYYIPSAFLREFIAIVVEQKRIHLVFALPVLLLTVVVALS